MDGGRIVAARVALGGVAPLPWRSTAAENILTGAKVSDAVIARAAAVALDGAQPLAHNGYKITLTQALVRRALRELTSQASKH
jgi:xanthine dehydrogenase YagS FAD-binding subunit